jgi:MFS transporter, DHA2 family, multidrug resistance protein
MLADKSVLGLMYKNLIREATMLAFNDTFFVMSVMMLCLVPFVFIMRKASQTEIGPVH